MEGNIYIESTNQEWTLSDVDVKQSLSSVVCNGRDRHDCAVVIIVTAVAPSKASHTRRAREMTAGKLKVVGRTCEIAWSEKFQAAM